MDTTPINQDRIIRLARPSLVILCGPTGCGKSTFAARHFRGTQILSSDRMRALVSDDEEDRRYQTQALRLLYFLISQRLSINRMCVADSPALTHSARANLLEVARQNQAPSTLILFGVPAETCIARDAVRARSMGRPVIDRQFQLFEQTKAALQEESYSQIVELSEPEMERVKIEIVFRPLQRPRGSGGSGKLKVIPRKPDGATDAEIQPGH